jgi:hypothetical protein
MLRARCDAYGHTASVQPLNPPPARLRAVVAGLNAAVMLRPGDHPPFDKAKKVPPA